MNYPFSTNKPKKIMFHCHHDWMTMTKGDFGTILKQSYYFKSLSGTTLFSCDLQLQKYLKTKHLKSRSWMALRARVMWLTNVWGWTQRAVTPQLFRGSRLTGSTQSPLISAIGSNLIVPWTLKPTSWQWNGLYKPLCENLQGLAVLFLKLLNSSSC